MGLPTPIGVLAAILAISSMLSWEHALFRVPIVKVHLKVAVKVKELKEALIILKELPTVVLKEVLIVILKAILTATVLKAILTAMEMVNIPIHLPATSRV